jgi:hypothetical protein
MKKLILILFALIAFASCSPTRYHYDSKERAYINKANDTIRWYYLPNRVY